MEYNFEDGWTCVSCGDEYLKDIHGEKIFSYIDGTNCKKCAIENRLKRYMDKVESDEYEKNAWDNFHNGNKKVWNKWAIRQRFIATVLRPYLQQKGVI